ncbi:hypothetical protein JKP88DRAFT_273078 [Tribonema minus]|uniref:Uncharacterized protein n=1 Tax=Tribonema minus TaxID=303371 RepID=A0A835YYK5_9STRA|nr:hypothetical protein JKP88DRAFT_273078 [Tribonema minus]
MAPADPWSDALLVTSAVRSAGKRRRRTLYAGCGERGEADPGAQEGSGCECAEKRGSLEGRGEGGSPPIKKKKMMPAVATMSVREERKALQEIRSLPDPKPHQILKSCNMTAASFAVAYVLGHHLKRKLGNKTRRSGGNSGSIGSSS